MTVEVRRSTTVPAPAAAVWEVLADFAAISRWATKVDHSCPATAAAAGTGAVRRVQLGRTTLLERIVEWHDGHALAYAIEGLPPPAGTVVTRWRLEPGAAGTQVAVSSTIRPAPGPPGRLAARIVGRRLAAAADDMLADLTAHLIHPPARPPANHAAPVSREPS